MKLLPHFELRDKHAFLAPSSVTWIRYDIDHLDKMWHSSQAAQLGTRMHALAAELISLRIKLPPTQKTINQFVNDAIGFRMTPEQPLFYSFNCFGTADALSFRDNVLRIHDLKNGVSRTSIDQLVIYAAIFCLEYDVLPKDISIILRIYKSDKIEEVDADPVEIMLAMDQIKTLDNRIEELKKEER
jgi:Protein of unknown function (DUF2800)